MLSGSRFISASFSDRSFKRPGTFSRISEIALTSCGMTIESRSMTAPITVAIAAIRHTGLLDFFTQPLSACFLK